MTPASLRRRLSRLEQSLQKPSQREYVSFWDLLALDQVPAEDWKAIWEQLDEGTKALVQEVRDDALENIIQFVHKELVKEMANRQNAAGQKPPGNGV